MGNHESPSGGKAYKELTRLKIDSPNKTFLQQTVTLPLKYLSMCDVYPWRSITLKDVLDFLDKFSGTFTELYLYLYSSREWYSSEPQQVLSTVTYQLVTKLYICYPDNQEICEAYERILLPRFPNLESLIFIDYSDHFFRDARLGNPVLNYQGFWRGCTKLRTIAVLRYPFNASDLYESVHTREMFNEVCSLCP